MRLLFYYFGNSNCGLGHFIRSTALANHARQMGHNVYIASDKLPLGYWGDHFILTQEGQPNGLYAALAVARPDWLIIDIQGGLPAFVVIRPESFRGGKICVIDGVGQPESLGVDLVVSQGITGGYKYQAPEYLILRPELFEFRQQQPGVNWFVFGGAADRMGLLPAFQQAVDWPAYLLVTKESIDNCNVQSKGNQWVTVAKDDMSLFRTMAMCRKAVCALGMTVWELLTLGVPCYVFSYSDRHLETALEMASRGWVKAWPEPGLPGPEQVREFLNEDFEPVKVEGLDGQGAARVVRLLGGYK